MNKPTHSQPAGKLLLRTLAMPEQNNPNGHIFGGWIMSQMDLATGLLAAETAQGRVTTVAVDKLSFWQAILAGDVVNCYGEVIKIGNTSLQIKVEVWIERLMNEEVRGLELAADAVFTYVAVDKNGVPRPVQNT
ncbi:MAG: acyl-CoA thioesterase [Neisseria sp.]|nr:acyl-CoA thioesterase [Neisseria sp.]